MTVGSGLYLHPAEKDQKKINNVIRQVIEGRSNGVGTITLTHDNSATSTVATANTCGPNSAVFLSAITSTAAALITSTYVKQADIISGQFTVTHAATSTVGVSFNWVCLG